MQSIPGTGKEEFHSSFLDNSDIKTKQCCLYTKDDYEPGPLTNINKKIWIKYYKTKPSKQYTKNCTVLEMDVDNAQHYVNATELST